MRYWRSLQPITKGYLHLEAMKQIQGIPNYVRRIEMMEPDHSSENAFLDLEIEFGPFRTASHTKKQKNTKIKNSNAFTV